MNLGEAADLLVRKVKRPEKYEDAVSAINRAIGLFATSTFYHDLVEDTLAVDASTYIHAIAINTAPFTRFRKMKYIKPTGYRKYVISLDPSRVFQHGCEQLDVYYRSGNYIKMKLSNLQSSIELGYYQYHPALVDPDDTDWMLDEMWPAIETYAVAELQEDIGNIDEANRLGRKWPVLLQAYKDDLGDGTSYG